MNMHKRAEELFGNGFNCAQAVFASAAEKMGLDSDTALGVAGSFGGGMRCGEVCGAASGALMAIGMRYAQRRSDDMEAKALCGSETLKFMDAFKSRRGTLLCREIIGYDPRDTEARMAHAAEHKELCSAVINDAISILEEMGF